MARAARPPYPRRPLVSHRRVPRRMRRRRRTDVIERVIELGLPLTRSRELVVDEFERSYVQNVLDRHGGDATQGRRSERHRASVFPALAREPSRQDDGPSGRA